MGRLYYFTVHFQITEDSKCGTISLHPLLGIARRIMLLLSNNQGKLTLLTFEMAYRQSFGISLNSQQCGFPGVAVMLQVSSLLAVIILNFWLCNGNNKLNWNKQYSKQENCKNTTLQKELISTESVSKDQHLLIMGIWENTPKRTVYGIMVGRMLARIHNSAILSCIFSDHKFYKLFLLGKFIYSSIWANLLPRKV